jgi:Putative peptidoglycan binding domain
MDTFTYTYSYDSYEKEKGIEYNFSEITINWKKLPNSSWLSLLGLAFLGSLTIMEPSFALKVKTPDGGCLNARMGPSETAKIYTCVRNGAMLAAKVDQQGNWLKLSTGRWVYAPYTDATSVATTKTTPTPSKPIVNKPSTSPVATHRSLSLIAKNPMRGNDVIELQKALKNKGYSIKVDGVFGTQTESLVKRFQASSKLASDGVVGKNTRKALGLS